MMKKHMILLAVALLGFSALQAQGAFDLEVKTLDGNVVTLSDELTGDLIVLDFWTTWCKPCIRSIPEIIGVSEKYDESKVQFIGMNEDSPRNQNKVKPMVNSLKIPYTVLVDNEQGVLSELMVTAFPTLLIMNRKGEVLYTHVGFSSGDEVELENKINELLAL